MATLPDNTRLSRNFFLGEFTRSQTAERLGIPVAVEAGSAVHLALQQLTVELLQPLRDALGPVHISSGYRPLMLNRALASGDGSQHVFGQAADIVVSGHTPYAVCEFLAQSTLPFDQLIHEFGRWTHVSIAVGRAPRREALTIYRRPSAAQASTIWGLHRIEELLGEEVS